MRVRLQIILCYCVLFFAKYNCFSQNNLLATWPVGVPLCYLHFWDNGSYTVDTTGEWSPYRHTDTPAMMPDSANDVLFQCNGNMVVNKQLQLLENGDSLTDDVFYNAYYNVGNMISQSMVALPKKDSTFWLFYYSFSDSLANSGTGSPDRLYYAVVDMNAYNGMGKVVQKKIPIYKGIMGDCRLTAVKHANGRDWWLVNHGYVNDTYNKFLVTPDTVLGPFTQQIGSTDAEPDLWGMAQFTLDGSKYASGNITSAVNLMDFDRCSGLFSNWRPIKVYSENPWTPSTTNSVVHGLCFSPSGRYLYTTSLKYLLQYDTWSDTVEKTRTLIAKVDSTFKNSSPFYTMFVSPNNKVLIANYQGLPAYCNYHIIESPNLPGVACNFQKESLYIPSSVSNYTLPNVVNLHLGALAGSSCDTIVNTINPLKPPSYSILVFPNPSNDKVFIETKGYGTGGTLQVTDALGRITYVNNSFDETAVIKVSNWQNGIYFWKITQSDKLIGSGKLLIQH